jgi:hypothetical protein
MAMGGAVTKYRVQLPPAVLFWRRRGPTTHAATQAEPNLGGASGGVGWTQVGGKKARESADHHGLVESAGANWSSSSLPSAPRQCPSHLLAFR